LVIFRSSLFAAGIVLALATPVLAQSGGAFK